MAAILVAPQLAVIAPRIVWEIAQLRRLWLSGVVLAVGLVFGWPAGGFAAATGWVGDNHAAARLITATEATGSASAIEAGLEIRLAPGWHTYWRSPGDAGIPPSIDWAGSDNLAHAEIAWPAPQRWSLQGFETAGYENHVVLPIALTLAQPGRPVVSTRAATSIRDSFAGFG